MKGFRSIRILLVSLLKFGFMVALKQPAASLTLFTTGATWQMVGTQLLYQLITDSAL